MVSNRQLEERNARRDRIIDGALRVFKRLGIDGVTMNEIALESDFGKASLYYYFPSKEDVFQAIMENGWQNLWESIEDIVVNEQKPKKKFLTLLITIAEIVKSNQTLYEFLFAAPKAIPMNSENFDSWKSYQNRLYSTIMGILEDGVAAGEFVKIEPEILMRAIGGIFHSLIFPSGESASLSEKDLDMVLSKLLEPS